MIEDVSIQVVTVGKKKQGVEVIRSNRQKTDERFIVPILPEAKAILEKYDYKLPIITNQKYNDYLKSIASRAKINKNITSHVARHIQTFYPLSTSDLTT